MHGFGLVEMAVAVIVVGALSGTSFVGYTKYVGHARDTVALDSSAKLASVASQLSIEDGYDGAVYVNASGSGADKLVTTEDYPDGVLVIPVEDPGSAQNYASAAPGQFSVALGVQEATDRVYSGIATVSASGRCAVTQAEQTAVTAQAVLDVDSAVPGNFKTTAGASVPCTGTAAFLEFATIANDVRLVQLLPDGSINPIDTAESTGDNGVTTGTIVGVVNNDGTGTVTGEMTDAVTGETTGTIEGSIEGATGGQTGTLVGTVTDTATGQTTGSVSGTVTVDEVTGAVSGTILETAPNAGETQGTIEGDVDECDEDADEDGREDCEEHDDEGWDDHCEDHWADRGDGHCDEDSNHEDVEVDDDTAGVIVGEVVGTDTTPVTSSLVKPPVVHQAVMFRGQARVAWFQPADSAPVHHYRVLYLVPNSASMLYPRLGKDWNNTDPALGSTTWQVYSADPDNDGIKGVVLSGNAYEYVVPVSETHIAGEGWGREFLIVACADAAETNCAAPAQATIVYLVQNFVSDFAPCYEGNEYVYAIPFPATWGITTAQDIVLVVGDIRKVASNVQPGQVAVFRFPKDNGVQKEKAGFIELGVSAGPGVWNLNWTGMDSRTATGPCSKRPMVTNVVLGQ